MIWIILGLIFLVFTIYLIKMFLYADPKKIIKIIKMVNHIIFDILFFFGLKFSSFFLWLDFTYFLFFIKNCKGIAISKFFANLFNFKVLKYNKGF